MGNANSIKKISLIVVIISLAALFLTVGKTRLFNNEINNTNKLDSNEIVTINEYLTDVEITDKDGNKLEKIEEVATNNMESALVNIKLSFEVPTSMFREGEEWTGKVFYKIPDTLKVNEINSDKTIYDENGGIVGTYDISDDGLTTVEILDGPLSHGTVIKLQINYWGKVDFSKTTHTGTMEIELSDDIKYDVYIERTPEISITKAEKGSYEYNKSNSSLENEFTVTISTISGTDDKIVFSDTTTGFNSTTYSNISVTLIDENNNETDITNDIDLTNFNTKTELPALKPANKYVINYKLSGAVPSNVKEYRSVKNTAKVITTFKDDKTIEKEAQVSRTVNYEGADYFTIDVAKEKTQYTPTEDENYIYQPYRLTANLYNVKTDVELYDSIYAYSSINKLNVRIDSLTIDGRTVNYEDYIKSIISKDKNISYGTQQELFRLSIPGTSVSKIIVNYTVYASKQESYNYINTGYIKSGTKSNYSPSYSFRYVKPEPELPDIRFEAESVIDEDTCHYDKTRDVTIKSNIYINENHAELKNMKLEATIEKSDLTNITINEYDENENLIGKVTDYSIDGKKLTIENLNDYSYYEIFIEYNLNTKEESFNEAYSVSIKDKTTNEEITSYNDNKTIYIRECDLELPEIEYTAEKTKYDCNLNQLANAHYKVTINDNGKDLTGWTFVDNNTVSDFSINIYSGLTVEEIKAEDYNGKIKISFEKGTDNKIKIKLNNAYLEKEYDNDTKIVINTTADGALGSASGKLDYPEIDPVTGDTEIEHEDKSVCGVNIDFDFIEHEISTACSGNKTKVTTLTKVDINVGKSTLADYSIYLNQNKGDDETSDENVFDNTIKKIKLYTDEVEYTIEDVNATSKSFSFVLVEDQVGKIKIENTDYIFNSNDLIHAEIYTEDIVSNATTDLLRFNIGANYSGAGKGDASYKKAYNIKACSPVMKIITKSNADACYLGNAYLSYQIQLRKPEGGDLDWAGTKIYIKNSDIYKITYDDNGTAKELNYNNDLIEFKESTTDGKFLLGNLEVDKDIEKILINVTIKKSSPYSYSYISANGTVEIERNEEKIFSQNVGGDYYVYYCEEYMDYDTSIGKVYKNVEEKGDLRIFSWNSTVSNKNEREIVIEDRLENYTLYKDGKYLPYHYMTYDQVAGIVVYKEEDGERKTIDSSKVTVDYRELDPETNGLGSTQTAILNTLETKKDKVYISKFSFTEKTKYLEMDYKTTFNYSLLTPNYTQYLYNYLTVTALDNNIKYNNNAGVSIRKKDSTNLIHKDTITETSELVEGIDNIKYKEDDTYMYYRITVNKNGYLTSGATVTDILPEGTTLVQNYWSYGGISCNSSYYCDKGIYIRYTSQSNNTYYSFGTSSFTRTYDPETRKLTIILPNSPSYAYEIIYKVKVVEDLEDDKTYINKASIKEGDQSIESNEVKNTVLINKLSKDNDAYNGYRNELKYHFVFNPTARELNDNKNINLIDELNYSSESELIESIKLKSIEAYYYGQGEKGDPVELETPETEDENDIFKMNISLPDKAALYVEYSIEVKYTMDTPLNMSLKNTISLENPTITYAYAENITNIRENYSTVLAASNAINLNLLKVDSMNKEIKLNGAKFTLEIQEEDKWDSVGEITTANEGTASLVATKPILVNRLYRLKEIEAPLGYELNEDYLYFFYQSNLFNNKTSIDGIKLLEIKDNYITVKNDAINTVIEDNSSSPSSGGNNSSSSSNKNNNDTKSNSKNNKPNASVKNPNTNTFIGISIIIVCILSFLVIYNKTNILRFFFYKKKN